VGTFLIGPHSLNSFLLLRERG